MSKNPPRSVAPPLEGGLTLRAVALYEAAKAFLALGVGVAAVLLLGGDVDGEILRLMDHVGLSPDGPFANMLLHSMQRAEAIGGHAVLSLTLLYASVRLWVAVGLWLQKVWGEWLGAGSGAIYIPFEIEALVRHPGWTPILLLIGNVVIIAYLCARLWYRHARARRLGA
jgi:uncharacterized membrane protein (DUF2068 family)